MLARHLREITTVCVRWFGKAEPNARNSLIKHPLGTFVYTISGMHCMTVSLAQGGEGGEEKTREYLHKAGFREVKRHRLEHDITSNWYVVTK